MLVDLWPDEQPFLTPWTDGSPLDRARTVLRWHWEALADWSAQDWSLGLGVFHRDGRALGKVSLRAKDFPVVREVTTSSWLGLPHHGQGYGTEARLALLELAFGHLGAQFALTEVFKDNHASQAVSRKLGYQPDGISRDARGTRCSSPPRRSTAAVDGAARGSRRCRPPVLADLDALAAYPERGGADVRIMICGPPTARRQPRYLLPFLDPSRAGSACPATRTVGGGL